MNSLSKVLTKSISATLVFCLLSQDLFFAQGATPVQWPQFPKALAVQGLPLGEISIPADLGVKRSVRLTGGDEVIVNIQDAHACLGAQKSIAKILEDLVKDPTVFLALATAKVERSACVGQQPSHRIRSRPVILAA